LCPDVISDGQGEFAIFLRDDGSAVLGPEEFSCAYALSLIGICIEIESSQSVCAEPKIEFAVASSS
jgi:hypothetical protein